MKYRVLWIVDDGKERGQAPSYEKKQKGGDLSLPRIIYFGGDFLYDNIQK